MIFPQQRKLMGSSAQNSSGLRCAPVHVPGQVQRGSGESSEGSGEGLRRFGAEPGHVQQGSGEGSGEGSGQGPGGVGAGPGHVPPKPSQVQQGSWRRFRRWFRRRSGRCWCGARPGSIGCQRRFRRRFRRSRARSGSTGFRKRFGAEPGQVQQGSGEGSGERLGGFGAEPVRFNRICGHLTHGTQLRCFQRLASQHVRTI